MSRPRQAERFIPGEREGPNGSLRLQTETPPNGFNRSWTLSIPGVIDNGLVIERIQRSDGSNLVDTRVRFPASASAPDRDTLIRTATVTQDGDLEAQSYYGESGGIATGARIWSGISSVPLGSDSVERIQIHGGQTFGQVIESIGTADTGLLKTLPDGRKVYLAGVIDGDSSSGARVNILITNVHNGEERPVEMRTVQAGIGFGKADYSMRFSYDPKGRMQKEKYSSDEYTYSRKATNIRQLRDAQGNLVTVCDIIYTYGDGRQQTLLFDDVRRGLIDPIKTNTQFGVLTQYGVDNDQVTMNISFRGGRTFSHRAHLAVDQTTAKTGISLNYLVQFGPQLTRDQLANIGVTRDVVVSMYPNIIATILINIGYSGIDASGTPDQMLALLQTSTQVSSNPTLESLRQILLP